MTLSSVCVTLLFLVSAAGNASQQREGFADIPLYHAVLDQVFRYEPHEFRTMTILRYEPGEAPEMQLAFAPVQLGRAYRVERWNLPVGERSIWRQLARLATADTALSQEAAARAIKVEHTTAVIAANGRVGRLLQGASSLRVELSGADEFFLHGADYLIEITSPGRDVRLRLQGPVDGEKSRDSIIRWMTKVRRELGDVDLASIGQRSP